MTLARRHRVATLLHQRLRALETPTARALTSALRPDRLEAHAQRLQTHETIRAVDAMIDVPFLVVKGAALAQQCYDPPGLRTCADIDILIARRDFRSVTDALLAGFTHLTPDWGLLMDAGMAEVPLRHQASTVDLHWHLVARAGPRDAISLDHDALFARARTVQIGAIHVATLGHEDTLLHLCINSGLDGGRRLRQLVDVDRLLRGYDTDWAVFVDRAHRVHADALSSALLQRCRQLLGTPLPAGLLDELAPFRGWLPANAMINRHRRPDRRLHSGIASGILLASGRSTLRATLRSVATEVHDAMLERMTRLRRRVAPRSVRATITPTAERQARERYLRWVDAPV